MKAIKNPPKQWRIQSIAFKKSLWTLAGAKAWLRKNNKKFGSVDKKGNWWKFQQEEPRSFSKFRVFPFGEKSDGINATYAEPKKNPAKTKKKKKNPKSKQAGIPTVLIFQGVCEKIQYYTKLEKLYEQLREIKFPTWLQAVSSKGRFLTCNTAGTTLYVLQNKSGKGPLPERIAQRVKEGKKLFKKWSGSTGEADLALEVPEVKEWKLIGYVDTLYYGSDKKRTNKKTGRRAGGKNVPLYYHPFDEESKVKLYKAVGFTHVYKITPVWVTKAGIRDPK